MRIHFPPTERATSEPVRLEELTKRYGEHEVLAGVNLKVQRGERIGIIGRNGAGKTTLLRMIAGEIESSDGKIVIGSSMNVGYYAQHHAEALQRNATIYQEIAGIDGTATVTRIRSVLGAFLFSDDDVEKKIGVLSGGERARVALARLLIKPGNMLLMDEPTNHLDLASSEALAESLQGYDGTLIFVSHNRSFVRRLATRIWNVADGTVETYPGTLDEYMDTCRLRLAAADGLPDSSSNGSNGSNGIKAQKAGKAAAPTPIKPAAAPQPAAAAAPKAVSAAVDPKRREAERKSKNRIQKLEREVTDLETRIGMLETAQKERSEQLADPAVYADKGRSSSLLAEFKEAQRELEAQTARWEAAQAEIEQLSTASP
jgi:ATP-binding cassette subfamily F protein 3